jgi:hypothetical protein
VIVPSYFSTLAQSQNLQFLLDNSQLQLEQESIWRQFLNVGLPQMSLNFDTAIGRDRIAAAASVVDSDAPAPLRSRTKIELYKGKIPAIKEKFRMNQDDMRNLEVLRMLNGTGTALLTFLNKDLQEAAVSGDKRVDFMMLQALSTLQVDINVTNNPDGAAFGVVDLLPQSYQMQGVPVSWDTIASSTPIDDIDKWLNINWKTRGRQFGRIIMSWDRWLTFKNSTQVKTYLATFYNTGKSNGGSFVVTLNTVNEMMTAQGWPPIEIINHITHIETDGGPTYVRPFDINNVVFAPSGKLGTLFNAISMSEMHPVAGKNYAKFGPTLVSKWGEDDPLVEFTGMEMNAFPSINVDSIYILKTTTVQASFT